MAARVNHVKCRLGGARVLVSAPLSLIARLRTGRTSAQPHTQPHRPQCERHGLATVSEHCTCSHPTSHIPPKCRRQHTNQHQHLHLVMGNTDMTLATVMHGVMSNKHGLCCVTKSQTSDCERSAAHTALSTQTTIGFSRSRKRAAHTRRTHTQGCTHTHRPTTQA